MTEIETHARHYVDARLDAEVAKNALEDDPRLAEVNARIANLRDMMAAAKAAHDEVALDAGLLQRIEDAEKRQATTEAHLKSIWMQELEAEPKTQKTVTLASGDQVQLKVSKGLLVTDPRALFVELDKRRLWTTAIEKPDKLAAALNAKALRPLCDGQAGEDRLPGIEAADKPSLALRRAKGASP